VLFFKGFDVADGGWPKQRLCSSAASDGTGQSISVDGGFTMR